MSYSAVVTDNSLLTMIHWKLVVLDEAQNIKIHIVIEQYLSKKFQGKLV